MRLLNIDSFTFEEFYSDIPKYAIASHRWFRGSEAAIKDVRKQRNTNTPGYKKVEGFARYVKAHIAAVKYLWIDTCCINQLSSQEVSEAVNSMFEWYLKAEVCLAYLSDVDTTDAGSDFQQSEWFLRGWTLQELLASQTVIFLTRDWQVIGHKGGSNHGRSALFVGPNLEASIASFTGIPQSVLRDFQQSQRFNTEEKLAWVQGRDTLRAEDMTYCLYGVFGVTLGANYGEGGPTARSRLLAAVADRNTSQADLERMPVAEGASYDSFTERDAPKCLEGTRTLLLSLALKWAEGVDGKPIFWLCGKAGTGKSTLARTIAYRLDKEQNCLGASFFFIRGEADRRSSRKVFPTIAAQLCKKIPGMAPALVRALDNGACQKTLGDQFDELLLKPIAQLSHSPRKTCILVLDALDECEAGMDIRAILKLLARVPVNGPVSIRVFVTSRPQLPIQLGFRQMNGNMHQDVILEEVQASTIADDIRSYFDYRFSEIRDEDSESNIYDPLPEHWPGEDNMQTLVGLAVPLFIFAFTICRFISESEPQSRLEMVLRQKTVASSGLEKTYLPILDQHIAVIDADERAGALVAFHELVGPIILLADPLSAQSLSNLLGISLRDIGTRLKHLHSVLDIPRSPSDPIRIFHLSFRDFLVESKTKQAGEYWIDEAQAHKALAERCLVRLMQPGVLRQDLRDVKKPGTRRTGSIEAHGTKPIPSDVAYACSYWAWHQVQSRRELNDDDLVFQFLQTHFLHWLEALSWVGRIATAIAFITDLRSLVNAHQGVQLLTFIDDAKRFVLRNRYIIDLAPLQTYYSAIIFTPARSRVRLTFEKTLSYPFSLLPKVPLQWSPELQHLEGHSYGVNAVVYSPDGDILALASYDRTIRLWYASTGEEMQKLEGHQGSVYDVAFSPDGQRLVSASEDRTVRLWDIRTGEEILKFLGHERDVLAVAFASDGETVASASFDMTVRLWNVRDSGNKHVFEVDTRNFVALSFSLDGKLLALAGSDRTVLLWTARTHEEINRFVAGSKEDRDWVMSAAFSPDCGVLALGTSSGRLHLYNTRTGEKTVQIENHNEQLIMAMAFSQDGRCLLSGSDDLSLRLWNPQTGQETKRLKGSLTDVHAVAISRNGEVASASSDGTVRLWSTQMGKTQKVEGHDGMVFRVELSHDGAIAASTSDDQTIRLWDTRTGAELRKFEQRVPSVLALTFSSNGGLVASASSDGTIRLWNIQTNEELKLEGLVHDVQMVAFSPGGEMVASCAYSGSVHVWDSQTGVLKYHLEGHERMICAVAFSKTALLAATSSNGMVRLWDSSNGAQTKKMVADGGSTGRFYAVALSPELEEGVIVVSASSENTIRLWNTRTGKQICLIPTDGTASRLEFSSDGNILRTDVGIFDLRPDPVTSALSSDQAPALWIHKQWIRRYGEDFIWLPHEYRGPDWAAFENVLVIGQENGAVSFFRST